LAAAGIEADGTTTQSPRNLTVLAEIPNLYGPGLTAKMTYYETKRGAQVFAAGAFGFAGATYDRRVSRLLANVWARMAGQPAAPLLASRHYSDHASSFPVASILPWPSKRRVGPICSRARRSPT